MYNTWELRLFVFEKLPKMRKLHVWNTFEHVQFFLSSHPKLPYSSGFFFVAIFWAIFRRDGNRSQIPSRAAKIPSSRRNYRKLNFSACFLLKSLKKLYRMPTRLAKNFPRLLLASKKISPAEILRFFMAFWRKFWIFLPWCKPENAQKAILSRRAPSDSEAREIFLIFRLGTSQKIYQNLLYNLFFSRYK